jgi:hypothetical protein
MFGRVPELQDAPDSDATPLLTALASTNGRFGSDVTGRNGCRFVNN